MPLGEACGKLYERMPLPEANFFGIVIAIQQKAGGNLSEALGNLSRVLRDRKKMKAKIQAMSMEAKASAAIIGALPICVMMLVWITSPQYIALLLDRTAGPPDARRLRHLDVVRRPGDEENDQLRLLVTAAIDVRTSDRQSTQSPDADDDVCRRRRGRDRADAGDAAACSAIRSTSA